MSIKEIPHGWTSEILGSLLELKYGKALPDKNRTGDGYPVFGSNGQVGKHKAPLSLNKTIIVGRKGSVGLVNYSDAPCSPIDTTYYIDSVPCGSFRYWFHQLKALRLSDLNKSTAIPGLTRADAYALKILLPPDAEQRRIADKLDTILTRVDALNDRLARITPLLKRFRQSVLAAATSGRLTEDWRVSHLFAAWGRAEIQDVAQVGTGSTPLRSNSEFFSFSGTPWVTSSATSEGIVRRADEYVTGAAIAAHRLKIYPIGTLLVAMYGEGKTRGQVTELGICATINQACAAIVVDETKISKSFVKLTLQANYLEMRVLAEGGNQPNLNLSKVKSFGISVPPHEEQTEIVRRVEILFAYADRLEARLQSARTAADRLTPALLAKAFRGELVPQDPNDEPATELLRRLREARAAEAPAKKVRGRKAQVV